jgi:hypothetical protein
MRRLTLSRNLKWSTLLGLLLVAGIGVFAVQAADSSYIGTTVLVSKVSMTEGGYEFSGADQVANYASITWFNEDCDGNQSSDSPYIAVCNSDVLDAPPLIAFASRATNLVEGMSDEESCGTDAQNTPIYCADIFIGSKGQDFVNALTLGGSFTQYPKGDALFPTLARDGRFLVFQSASEYAEVEGGDETPETDIWLMDLTDLNNPAGPYRISNFNRASGGLEQEANADSGNVACRVNPADPFQPPLCEVYTNGTTKPNLNYPHPVADVYWQDLNANGRVDLFTEVFVAFESIASNLDQSDGNGHIKDIFLGQPSDKGYTNPPQYERGEGSLLLTRAPTCSNGQPTTYDQPTDGDSYHPVFVDLPGKAQDGRFLLFVSRATNLICGLSANDYQNDDPNAGPMERRANVFLLDRDYDGDGAYDEFDQAGGTRIYLLSQAPDGRPANGTTEYPAAAYIIEENNHSYLMVAFQSRATNLAPENLPEGKASDDNGFSDIYLFRFDVDPNGANYMGIVQRYLVSVPSVPLGADRPAALANQASYAPSISRDGLVIGFHSYASNLVEGDTNECPYTGAQGIEGQPAPSCPDVFGHDREARQTWRVSLTSIGQQGDRDAVYAALSATGQFAAFASYSDLDLNANVFIPQNISQIYLRDMGNPPGNPNVQPTYWDWGTLHLNTPGEAKTFSVRFLANSSITDIDFQVTSPETPREAFGFTYTCEKGVMYTRGGYCTFTVRFMGGSTADKDYSGEVYLKVKWANTNSERTVRIGVRARTAYYYPLASVTDLSAGGTPGSTVTYTFTVENAGDLAEDLVLSDPNRGNGTWITAFPTALSNVQPGGSDRRTVQVQVRVPPSGVSVGQVRTDQIVICSSHDPTACWTVNLSTTVDNFRTFIPAVMR